VLIVIAAICGAVGKALGGTRGGLAASLALGFIGALLGPWVARQRSRPEPFVLHVPRSSWRCFSSSLDGERVSACVLEQHAVVDLGRCAK